MSSVEVWLKVAEDLKPGADPALREPLNGAVTAAIQRNPVGVLEMIGRVFRVSEVCRVGVMEGTSEPAKEFVDRTREALEGVTRPALATRRYECLQQLPHAEEAMAGPR